MLYKQIVPGLLTEFKKHFENPIFLCFGLSHVKKFAIFSLFWIPAFILLSFLLDAKYMC